MKQGIEVPDHLLNMVEPNRKILKIEDNNMNHTQYNQSYYNNNNLPNNSPYYYYGFDNNTSSDLYSNINSQYKEDKKRLSIDDKIKIQKVLKNLENYLKKFYPPMFIFQILSWLHYQCLTQKSDEPLKKFLVQKNIGFLWQF
jgi:dynactin complex subunit